MAKNTDIWLSYYLDATPVRKGGDVAGIFDKEIDKMNQTQKALARVHYRDFTAGELALLFYPRFYRGILQIEVLGYCKMNTGDESYDFSRLCLSFGELNKAIQQFFNEFVPSIQAEDPLQEAEDLIMGNPDFERLLEDEDTADIYVAVADWRPGDTELSTYFGVDLPPIPASVQNRAQLVDFIAQNLPPQYQV